MAPISLLVDPSTVNIGSLVELAASKSEQKNEAEKHGGQTCTEEPNVNKHLLSINDSKYFRRSTSAKSVKFIFIHKNSAASRRPTFRQPHRTRRRAVDLVIVAIHDDDDDDA